MISQTKMNARAQQSRDKPAVIYAEAH